MPPTFSTSSNLSSHPLLQPADIHTWGHNLLIRKSYFIKVNKVIVFSGLAYKYGVTTELRRPTYWHLAHMKYLTTLSSLLIILDNRESPLGGGAVICLCNELQYGNGCRAWHSKDRCLFTLGSSVNMERNCVGGERPRQVQILKSTSLYMSAVSHCTLRKVYFF